MPALYHSQRLPLPGNYGSTFTVAIEVAPEATPFGVKAPVTWFIT
jgi:hypothetical protein